MSSHLRVPAMKSTTSQIPTPVKAGSSKGAATKSGAGNPPPPRVAAGTSSAGASKPPTHAATGAKDHHGCGTHIGHIDTATFIGYVKNYQPVHGDEKLKDDVAINATQIQYNIREISTLKKENVELRQQIKQTNKDNEEKFIQLEEKLDEKVSFVDLNGAKLEDQLKQMIVASSEKTLTFEEIRDKYQEVFPDSVVPNDKVFGVALSKFLDKSFNKNQERHRHAEFIQNIEQLKAFNLAYSKKRLAEIKIKQK